MSKIHLCKWKVRAAAENKKLRPINQGLADILSISTVALRAKWESGFKLVEASFLANKLGVRLSDIEE